MGVGAISNPTLTNPGLNGFWDMTYTYAGETPGSRDSSVRLNALAGNITLTGQSVYYGSGSNLQTVLPPTVELYAANNIFLQNSFSMAPSPTGNLRLAAGGDIEGQYTDSFGIVNRGIIYMSDQDLTTLYSFQQISSSGDQSIGYTTNYIAHAPEPVHLGDTNPVLLSAGGDIRDLDIYMPKQTVLIAGLDIRDIFTNIQNISSNDKSEVLAGRDIVFSAGTAAFQGVSGIEVEGPGQLLVQAGRNIDLGTSEGIKSVGNFQNPALPSTGSAIIVAAGINYNDYQLSESDEIDFFNGLRTAGTDYANEKASGDSAAAIATITGARTQLIDPRFTGGLNSGIGNIEMVNSSISSLSGKADLYVLARSQIDVGLSTFENSSQVQASGIFTASGGNINVFSGGDMNVNESRVMTYLGGNITAWSDQGSINAGRGSKTAINSQPPTYNAITKQYVFSPPSAGSGVRALTYVPDVQAGDIYLFAPQGVIDAGEAGIAGGKVILGATQVLNSQNISFSAGSVGVPSSSASSIGIGALSGSSGLADSSKLIEQSTGTGAAKDTLKNSTQVLDDFMSKFLDVKVISFDEDDTSGSDTDKDKDKKKNKK
jgi:filamentous hemagglutinin